MGASGPTRALRIRVSGGCCRATARHKSLYSNKEAVDSLPLIASSVMSKKLAEGARALVLDVKAGRGAFLKTEAESRELAATMVALGNSYGVQLSTGASNNTIGGTSTAARNVISGGLFGISLDTVSGDFILDAYGVNRLW